MTVLPDFNSEGDLSAGVHRVGWEEFVSRFGQSTLRRVWLLERFEVLLQLATATGKLRRIFVWGSFVTAKPNPKDLDILLLMDADFEVDAISPHAQEVFDATRAKLRFHSDVFWARISIGEDILALWLDTYQTTRSFRKRGIVELELS
jgi:hypothetical protein